MTNGHLDDDGRPTASWPSIVLVVPLVAVFVVGFVLLSSVVVVRGRVLDDSTYTDALARNDAYERVYTQVLADPEMAELVDQLIGGLQFHELDPVQVRQLSTSALRWSVPPATLQRGTEAVIAAVLAYVRGDTRRLDPDVDVSQVLEGIEATAVRHVHTLLASASDRVAVSLADYEAAVGSFADQIASGTVPGAVPVLGDTAVDTTQVADVILRQLGTDRDPRVRQQVAAAAAAGDERDALITATAQPVAQAAEAGGDRLRAGLENGRELDVVHELADRADQRRAAIVDRLDSVRRAAAWFRPATGVVGAVLMAMAAAGLVWTNRSRPRRAALALAAASLVAGLTLLALWVVVTGLVDAPLAAATTTGPGSWNLPGGLRLLLSDVEGTLADELAQPVRWLVVVPVVAGGVAALLLVVAPRLRVAAVRRLAAPRLVAAGVGAVVLVGLVGSFVASDTAGAADSAQRCNGHVELCGRRYDQVVYAATHNSMSSPDVVSVWPEHDGNIQAQLDHGIRTLLIDTHHWTPLVSADQLTSEDMPLTRPLAQQVFDSLGSRREGRDGTFLCHNQCSLGAIPFVDALGTIREFLDDNPDEVVTLIIQDAISPAETADAFTEAHLDRYLHVHRDGTAWDTLGEMVDSGERLVVFAETEGPPPAWYHQAFEHMQDTPYLFESASDFSCAPNRGDDDAPLFLLNHWVTGTTPDRVNAVEVNRHEVLVNRARQCRRERGLKPNYIAVDFYNIGDLTEAVDTLNGLD